jgi:hypothetical protein
MEHHTVGHMRVRPKREHTLKWNDGWVQAHRPSPLILSFPRRFILSFVETRNLVKLILKTGTPPLRYLK